MLSKLRKQQAGGASVFVLIIALGIACFAAWITHVVACIKAATWVFLLAGAIFAPIGVVHGVGIWFGAW